MFVEVIISIKVYLSWIELIEQIELNWITLGTVNINSWMTSKLSMDVFVSDSWDDFLIFYKKCTRDSLHQFLSSDLTGSARKVKFPKKQIPPIIKNKFDL